MAAHHHLIRSSLLPGFATLTLLMAFATDVIAEVVLTDGLAALGLTLLGLAAISLAGTVLTAHAAKAEAD